MYQAAAAMTGNARWQEAISENLAATTVPGFKRTEISFSNLASGFVAPGETGSQIEQGMRYQLPSVRTSTAFSQGEFHATGVPTHVAVEGDGFFEVQLPNGELGYTRNGEFSIGNGGQLVTSQGFPVLSDGGVQRLLRGSTRAAPKRNRQRVLLAVGRRRLLLLG